MYTSAYCNLIFLTVSYIAIDSYSVGFFGAREGHSVVGCCSHVSAELSFSPFLFLNDAIRALMNRSVSWKLL